MKPSPPAQLEFDVCPAASSTRESEPLTNPIRNPERRPPPRVPLPEAIKDGLESLVTFAQAARFLGISLRQFRWLVDGGKVAFVKVSEERSPRIRPSELQRFLAASVVKYPEVKS